MSEEALQIAEKKREVKGKGGRGRYTQLDAEFQRIARDDKKAFLNEKCKEIKENNRMGKTRSFQENWRHQGCLQNFHARMGTIKDRNSKDITEAEENKRWQEYTELYKKGLNDLHNHDGVVTH